MSRGGPGTLGMCDCSLLISQGAWGVDGGDFSNCGFFSLLLLFYSLERKLKKNDFSVTNERSKCSSVIC